MDTENDKALSKELVKLLDYVFAGPHLHWKFREWLKENKITALSLKGKLRELLVQQQNVPERDAIREEHFVRIGEALRITAVTHLDLSCNNLGAAQKESYIAPKPLFDIGKSLKGTPLKSINLSNNRLSMEAIIFFLEGMIAAQKELGEINFSYNAIGLR